MFSSRRFAGALALAALFTACSESTAPDPGIKPQFIYNGEPTGSSFGSVGALIYDFEPAGITGDDALCTGSLISPTVFLTAAHCVEFLPAGSQLYVSFDDNLYPTPKPLIAASAYYYDPLYGHDQADLHDLAVVILPKNSTRGMKIYALPPAGYLDALAAKGQLSKETFVNVGYGTGSSHTGVPSFPYDGIRKFSYSEFMALQPSWLGLLMNSSATGEGGDCYGDSGGPKFMKSNLNMVVATVTTGDYVCRATTWDYRVDTPSARAFLGRFVTLP